MFKKTLVLTSVALSAIVLFFTFCGDSGTPDYCGDGHPLNRHTQFCFGGETFDKCNGQEYNPTTQFCSADDTLIERCDGSSFDPVTHFCASNNVVTELCGGLEPDPVEEMCVNGVIVVRPSNFSVSIISEIDGATGAGNYNVGDPVLIIAGDDTEDKRFRNWTTESAGVTFSNPNNRTTVFIMPRNEVVVTANYEDIVKEYHLTVIANPSTRGVVIPQGTTTHIEGTAVTVTATPASGYVFVRWSGVPLGIDSTEQSITFEINDHMTLTAGFADPEDLIPKVITTDIIPIGGGTIIRNPNSASYEIGTSVTMTATPNEGYEFIGWTGDFPSPDSMITFDTYKDMRINANFKRIHTLTIDTIGGGRVTRDPQKNVYDDGETVEVVAVADNGYRFVNWTGTGAPENATESRLVITMNANKTLVANFVRVYNVTVSSVGSGVSGDGSYAQGDTVRISAGTTTTPGLAFINWTSTSAGVAFANANNATTTFVMPNNDVEIVANFSMRDYTVTFMNGTTVHSTQRVTHGQTVSLPPTPSLRTGASSFKGWYSAATGGELYTSDFSVTRNVTLYAQWLRTHRNTHTITANGSQNIDLSNIRSSFATIDVYALGGGGGGQGGYTVNGLNSGRGTGGGGGGGAAAWMRFVTPSSGGSVDVVIGAGGNGNNGSSSNNVFNPQGYGNPGEETTVRWRSSGGQIVHTLRASGGFGGGSNISEQRLRGGAGGATSTRPTTIEDANWTSVAGGTGQFGVMNNCGGSGGGDAASITNKGSILTNPFGESSGGWVDCNDTQNNRPSYHAPNSGAGGAGGWSSSNSGTNGGNGIVIVTATYEVDFPW